MEPAVFTAAQAADQYQQLAINDTGKAQRGGGQLVNAPLDPEDCVDCDEEEERQGEEMSPAAPLRGKAKGPQVRWRQKLSRGLRKLFRRSRTKPKRFNGRKHRVNQCFKF